MSPDQDERGVKTPSSMAPSGPTPMDTDQTILNSALGASSRTDSGSGVQNPSGPDQARGEPTSDAAMTDAEEAAQRAASSSLIGNAMQAESAASTGPSGANDSALTRQGSKHEEEVAQLGFAVQFMVQGLRNGAGPTLMPLLVRLLPFLLKTQVCSPLLHCFVSSCS